MTGVPRAVLLLSALALAGSACATKVPPRDAGQPVTQPIVLEDVPRHVDGVMHEFQAALVTPAREALRASPASDTSSASDGSYGRWLTEVSESLVTNNPLPQDFDRLSERAYRDLAHIARLPVKRDAATLDLSLIARRLHMYFEKQSPEVRKTAAMYIESKFSIPA